MGYATIVSGGAGGRYTIEMDFGEAHRNALVAAIDSALTIVGDQIIAAQLKVDLADIAEAEQQEIVRLEAQVIAVQGNNLPAGSPAPDTTLYKAALKDLRALQVRNSPYRTVLTALKRNQAELIAKRSSYVSLVLTQRRQAWCVDRTENASGVVATVDVNGESELVLIGPLGRGWNPTDGVMKARELMSPEQAYFNAAILPGWQKFLPTYRWGTLTFVDDNSNTGTVDLFDATSSANRLYINQAGTLTNVSFQYMFCNSRAFEVGDRVVVQFLGQNQALPKIIGFLDTPKYCNGWNFEGLGSPGGSAFFTTTSQLLADIMRLGSGGLVLEFRINGGTWVQLFPSVESIRTGYANLEYTEANDIYTLGFLFFPGNSIPTLPPTLFANGIVGICETRFVHSFDNISSSAEPFDIMEFRATYQDNVILNFSIEELRDVNYASPFRPVGVRTLGDYNANAWSRGNHTVLSTPLFLEEE